MLEQNHDDLKIGELPELRIVSTEQIIFHEEPDIERVARLVERFSADGVLKNPPVVARTNRDSRRILLDGANRVTALRKLDFPDVLVQEIDLDDPKLILDRWHHALEHLSRERLIQHARSIEGVTVEEADLPRETPGLLCWIAFDEGDAVTLLGSEDLLKRVEQLRAFTSLYHKHAYMDRVSYTNLEHLRRNYQYFTAIVSFPGFTKEELLTLTDAGVLLPSGVSRVLLPKRALRFNLHLDLLRSRLSLEEKNLWLQETIQQKIADKSIRFYREPTFFFDE